MQSMTSSFVRHGTAALLALILFSNAPRLLGAVPTNDVCANAVVIPPAGPFPHLADVVPDITEATIAGDPPLPSCWEMVSRSIWYKFTPQISAFYTFSVSFDTATTVEDTVMAIYSSSQGCAGPFTELDCSDDAFDYRSFIATDLNAGGTYYIVIWKLGLNSPTNGQTAVQLRVAKPAPPPNDNCVGAEIIPSSGPFPHLTAIADTIKATAVSDPPTPSCQGEVSRSVWYRFTPAATATYTISSCTNTATTIDDTVMAIYAAPSGCSGPWTEVACSDIDDCDDRERESISTLLVAGTNYYIVVWEYGTDPATAGKTLVQLRVSVPPPHSLTSTMLPNGHFKTRFSGLTGLSYTLQSSTNLTSWMDLGAPASWGTNTFEFIDTNAPFVPWRSYRVKSP